MRDQDINRRLAEGIKTQDELTQLTSALTKRLLERALDAELKESLGYDKHVKSAERRSNTRNGYSRKTLKGSTGELEIQVPRDRAARFEPQIIPKNKTRFGDLEKVIVSLFSKGMSVRDIQAHISDFYHGVDVSAATISNVTSAIYEEVQAWQQRPLNSVYPIIFLDGLVVKVRQEGRVINKTIYLALGITEQGDKDLLGLWLSEKESSKFWLSVLTDLQNRGVRDVFIFSVDGLSGFPQAIEAAFPRSKVQLCVVHMVRNSLRYVSSKDKKAVALGLKGVYSASSAQAAEQALDVFGQKWSLKYPSIERSWRSRWDNLVTIFDYPLEIRRVFYTTNAIESLNSVVRKHIKTRKIFPNDESALKIVYMAIKRASQRWTMPLRNWHEAMNRFAIEYGDRFDNKNASYTK